MKKVIISRKEYSGLKKKAKLNDDLLKSIVRGLEDIKEGRVKEWKF